jgi:phosphoribosylaminoimidazolecarboxamide formyltransferase/IMP cyclohydrolase
MIAVTRALLSCHDKTRLDDFARTLTELGVELVASSGTAAFLKAAGLPVRTVEEFAGIAEQLDGRLKTLHPAIHAGILARRDDPAHVAAVGAAGLIDLVIVNLYPFQDAVQRPGVALAEALEQIDVGGVALVRAAAKNFPHVAVVCRPQQYAEVAEALRRGRGQLPDAAARQLAATAFELVSAYDAGIAAFLEKAEEPAPAGHVPSATGGPDPGRHAPSAAREDARPLTETKRAPLEAGGRDRSKGAAAAAPTPVSSAAPFPEIASVSLSRRQVLRYGENPHQRAAWYVPSGGPRWGLGTLRQHQGKALSYNNLLDLDAALRCLLDVEEPACVIIKHRAPCGLAGRPDLGLAFRLAYDCDAEAAFGGVVGVNRPLDLALAQRLTEVFVEVVLAPAIEPAALGAFGAKRNLRVVTLDWPAAAPPGPAEQAGEAPPGVEWWQVAGSWLLQEAAAAADPAAWQAPTRRSPTPQEREDLVFAWTAVTHALSNGIVIARHQATLGIGQGQPSRVGSVRLALDKASRLLADAQRIRKEQPAEPTRVDRPAEPVRMDQPAEPSRSAVAASDGFFPFPDSIELLAKAGVTAVIQPGGSLRDAEVIRAADAAGMAMLLSGVRRFRH